MALENNPVAPGIVTGGSEAGVSAGGCLERQLSRKRSSADLGINYPGDLLSQAIRKRAVPPLLKRNTIADFANTKAYQASTASLMSGAEQPQGN